MLLLQANTTSLFNLADLQLIAPELILTACACVALVMEVILPYRKSKLTAYFSLIGVRWDREHWSMRHVPGAGEPREEDSGPPALLTEYFQ